MMIHKQYQNTKNAILLYIKYPHYQKVKTRLAPNLPQNTITTIYQKFIEDTITTLQLTHLPLLIFYTPKQKEKDIRTWLGPHHIYLSQHGNNLGSRMLNGFTYAFSLGYTHLILIGGDCPDIPIKIITKSFKDLTHHDGVIGPAIDGGYYLIGFTYKGFKKEYFTQIKWGSSQVFEQTTKKFIETHLNYSILPKWYDIDTINDLKQYFSRNKKSGNMRTKTMEYLLKNPDIIK